MDQQLRTITEKEWILFVYAWMHFIFNSMTLLYQIINEKRIKQSTLKIKPKYIEN